MFRKLAKRCHVVSSNRAQHSFTSSSSSSAAAAAAIGRP